MGVTCFVLCVPRVRRSDVLKKQLAKSRTLVDSVVVVGGIHAREPLASVLVLDEFFGEGWRMLPSLPRGRAKCGAAPLPRGGLLVVGGQIKLTRAESRGQRGTRWRCSAATYALELGAGSWRRLGNMSVKRSCCTAVALHDGRVLVLGGLSENSAAAEAGWRTAEAALARLPADLLEKQATREAVAAMAREWGGPEMVAVVDAEIADIEARIAAAEQALARRDQRPLAGVELFDPRPMAWTKGMKPLRTARAGCAACLLPVSTRGPDAGWQRVFVVGGAGAIDAEIYSVAPAPLHKQRTVACPPIPLAGGADAAAGPAVGCHCALSPCGRAVIVLAGHSRHVFVLPPPAGGGQPRLTQRSPWRSAAPLSGHGAPRYPVDSLSGCTTARPPPSTP